MAAGVRRIAVLDMNDPATIEAACGASRAGAVLTVVNWRLAPKELAYVLSDSKSELLLVGALRGRVVGVRDRLPLLREVILVGEEYEAWLVAQTPAALPDPYPDDVVLQLYTSSTTGCRKAVMLTHRGVAAHNAASIQVVVPSPDTVAMVPMPLNHVGGLAYALSNLDAASRTVIAPRAGAVGAARRDRGPGHHRHLRRAALLGAILADPSLPSRDLSGLRHVLYGASPMTAPLMRACLARFPGVLGQVYGMTELSGAVTYLSHPERLLSAGRPYPGVETRVAAADGKTCAGRAVGAVPAVHGGLLAQAGGDGRDARRGRVAADG